MVDLATVKQNGLIAVLHLHLRILQRTVPPVSLEKANGVPVPYLGHEYTY